MVSLTPPSHKRKVFGFTDYPDQEEQYFYLINLLILLTKFHIHKCKFTNKKNNFMVLLTEICIYIDSIRDSVNKKAVRTLKVCEFYNIFIGLYIYIHVYICISCFFVFESLYFPPLAKNIYIYKYHLLCLWYSIARQNDAMYFAIHLLRFTDIVNG